MRIMLEVPYRDREEAKKFGCRFSGVEKKWYIDNPDDRILMALMRWVPAHLKSAHNPQHGLRR